MTEKIAVRSESIRVPMRDATELSVHIYRPGGEGRFPAIVSYTPYGKGPLLEDPEDPMIAHGYAIVTFDIRGTGDSSGWNDSIYSAAERQDGYDMIEWTAQQSWCNGNVGMWGISFGAVVSLQMAAAAPPHLKAIIARSGSDDPYTEWTNPGGSPRIYMYQCYAPMMTARNSSPPDPAEWGEEWEEIWKQRLDNNVPWGIPFMKNLVDGPFWRDRSLRDNYHKVRCPVFVVGGWADWYHTPLLRIFERLEVPKRVLIGPWSHQWPDQGIPGPRIDWRREALKWWDHWLKGIDTGIMDEPPVTVFVREYDKPATISGVDRGTFRCENEWPIARTRNETLYLAADGYLSPDPPDEDGRVICEEAITYDPRVGTCSGIHGGGPFNMNWVRPLDQRPDEVHSLSYTGDALPENMEVTGRPRVVLHFSSTARIMLFVVKLCDVAPDGTSALVTKGYLNVAHRDSHSNPSYIEPDTPYKIEIEMLACAYLFEKGHRVRLNIANADFLNLWPTPAPCTNIVYRGQDRASAVVLPVVPANDADVPDPGIHETLEGCSIEDMAPPSFWVCRDIINDTATCRHSNPELQNEAEFAVSAKNPAEAVLRSKGEFHRDCGGRKIETHVNCLTKSDAASFQHTVELVVTIDGEEFFRKNWEESVPRDFF